MNKDLSDGEFISNAWLDACNRLWDMCYRHDRDMTKVTLWDAFKLLYLERVPKEERGRRARGVDHPFKSWEDKRKARK